MPKEDINGKLHSDNDGKFVSKLDSGEGKSYPQNTSYADIIASGKNKKMTPAEKIASVHIDFDKDNILPELNDEDLQKIGSNVNKPVLLKKNIIDRNAIKHNDLTPEDSQKIIAQSLYSDKKEIIPSKYKDKPNYFSFATIVRYSNKDGQAVYGVTLLDVDSKKEAFEIVHWHYVPYDKLSSIEPKK